MIARLARRVRRRLDRSPITKLNIEIERARDAREATTLRRLVGEVPTEHAGASAVLHSIRRSLAELGDEEGSQLALTAAAGHRNSLATAVWNLDDAPDGSVTRQAFIEAITPIVPADAIVQWERALAAATRPVRATPAEQTEPGREPRPHDHEPDSWSFLAVSGAGWSGSGAVFDHLRGHRRALAVPGESRLLEGQYGFRPLLANSEPDLGPRERLDLLRFCLLGFAPCTDWNDYRHVRNARRAATGPGAVAYATVCADVMDDLAHPGARTTLPAAARSLLDASIQGQLGTMDGVPILDNVVHIRHLGELAPIVPQVYFLAVVRDPRDQFLDNVRHNPRFRLDALRFARRYRHVRSLLETAEQEHPASIRVIQFEHFVGDPGFRDESIADLVSHLGHPDRRPHFDPDRSRENIGLWKASQHQDIDLISNELEEFLVD